MIIENKICMGGIAANLEQLFDKVYVRQRSCYLFGGRVQCCRMWIVGVTVEEIIPSFLKMPYGPTLYVDFICNIPESHFKYLVARVINFTHKKL